MTRIRVAQGSGPLAVTAVLLLLPGSLSATWTGLRAMKPGAGKMSQEQASAFARLALKGVGKEYPNKPADVLNSDKDVKSPRAAHPAFYGSFDWHSSVHG